MKNDAQIQKDVMEQLKWDPYLNAAEIGVAVKDGVVTLSGHVDAYLKKVYAERAAKKVKGVKAIAEDIQIGVSPIGQRSDTEIAEAVVKALKWHTGVQDEHVKIKVDGGVVYLTGEVDWEFQRSNARTAIENFGGVRSIINQITVKPRISQQDIQQKIGAAFQRHASLDAQKITAEVNGSIVTLRGTVRSFAEKDDAESAVWAAPGVTYVHNNLDIKV